MFFIFIANVIKLFISKVEKTDLSQPQDRFPKTSLEKRSFIDFLHVFRWRWSLAHLLNFYLLLLQLHIHIDDLSLNVGDDWLLISPEFHQLLVVTPALNRRSRFHVFAALDIDFHDLFLFVWHSEHLNVVLEKIFVKKVFLEAPDGLVVVLMDLRHILWWVLVEQSLLFSWRQEQTLALFFHAWIRLVRFYLYFFLHAVNQVKYYKTASIFLEVSMENIALLLAFSLQSIFHYYMNSDIRLSYFFEVFFRCCEKCKKNFKRTCGIVIILP